MRCSLRLACALAAVLVAVGCEQKKTGDLAPLDAQAGTDKYLTADPKLAKALKGSVDGGGAAENGPPPDGVFSPGVADQRHPVHRRPADRRGAAVTR